MKRPYPKRFLNWHLVVGVLIFGIMTLALSGISEDVINREPLTVTDAQLSTWLHLHRTSPLTRVMLVATSLGAPVAVTCITIVFFLYLLSRRRYYWLAAAAASVLGGMLLNIFLKYVFHRPRPLFDDPILTLTGYSFPSGHTMMATVLYGVLAAYLVANTSDWRLRALVILLTGVLIALVAFSRIYLGAHYLSDVLGAMAEGLAWLSLCLTLVYSFWRRRNTQPA